MVWNENKCSVRDLWAVCAFLVFVFGCSHKNHPYSQLLLPLRWTSCSSSCLLWRRNAGNMGLYSWLQLFPGFRVPQHHGENRNWLLLRGGRTVKWRMCWLSWWTWRWCTITVWSHDGSLGECHWIHILCSDSHSCVLECWANALHEVTCGDLLLFVCDGTFLFGMLTCFWSFKHVGAWTSTHTIRLTGCSKIRYLSEC